MYTKVKTDKEIIAMRESGRMLATVLSVLQQKITVGMTTKDLADIAATELKALGGRPPFLGMYGFPDVLCVSVNEEVVHGIPSTKRILQEGDIVGMDFGVDYRGMITDSAVTAVVGQYQNTSTKRLVESTKTALEAGIAAAHDGCKVGDIAAPIQTVLESAKLGIVKELVGHGVGHELHEEPNIPNYGPAGKGPVLETGMTIAIEPMATLGKPGIYIASDEWTVTTRDHSLSAHFEHTILLTDEGAEVLTIL